MMSLPVWLLSPMFLLGGSVSLVHVPLGGLYLRVSVQGVFVWGGGGSLSWKSLSRGGLCQGGLCQGGSLSGGLCLGGLCRETSLESENWVVHILLECFLVS